VALNSFTQTFTYDGVNRLGHAADTGGWSRDFNYDRYGNMWVTNATGIAATGATAQGNYEVGSNRMYGLGYDLAGNQLTANGDTLGYDAENRQVTVTEPPSLGGGTEYIAYDGDGKRVAKSGPAGTTVYVYDVLGQLAAEYATVAGPEPPAASRNFLMIASTRCGSSPTLNSQSWSIALFRVFVRAPP